MFTSYSAISLAFRTQTSMLESNIAGRSRQPAVASLSANLGLIPVARNAPRTLPVSSSPCRSKMKISCMQIISPSTPVTSETAITLREPSERRAICTTPWIADAICWRTARSGILRLAMENMLLFHQKFSRVFDGNDSLRIWDVAREHIEQRGFAGAGATGDQKIQAAFHHGREQFQHGLGHGLVL